MIVSSLIGSFGKYHAWICFLISIAQFSTGLQNMAFTFLAPPSRFNCSMPNETCCKNPEYDKTIFKRTIIMEWNLICDRSWLKDLCQILFQLGVLLGSLLFGIVSDSYGRRRSLLISLLIQVFTSLIISFMPGYWSFSTVRMMLGISQGGIVVVGYVLLMEYIGLKHRGTVSTLIHVPSVIGHIVLTVCAYYIRDCVYLLLTISFINLLLLFYICFLPESPLWLLGTNKMFKAITLLEHVAKINNKPTHNIGHKIEQYEFFIRNDKRRKANFADIFCSVVLRNNLLMMSFLWFVGGFCYYGGNHYIRYMTGNIFLNEALSGFVCLCGCFIVLHLIKYTRRRTLVIIFNIISGIFFLIIALFPENAGSIIGCVVVLFSFMNLIVMFLYCFEMFPTIVRNVALGFSSMTCVGAMVAPLVVGLHIYSSWFGPLIFGVVQIIGVLVCSFLPDETKEYDVVDVGGGVWKPISQRPETVHDLILEDIT